MLTNTWAAAPKWAKLEEEKKVNYFWKMGRRFNKSTNKPSSSCTKVGNLLKIKQSDVLDNKKVKKNNKKEQSRQFVEKVQ